jgi:hypothetical protein
MQVHEPSREHIELPRWQAIPDSCDFYSLSGEVSSFETPHRTLTAVLSAIALAASFGLGWSCAQFWPEAATALGLRQFAQNEVPSPRVARSGPTTKHSYVSKPTSAVASQAFPSLDRASNSGLTIGPRIVAESSAVARAPWESTGTVSPAQQPAFVPLEVTAIGPLAPAPETRPTTIPGWIVADVNEGAAVLAGPDGPLTVRRGDTIPGIGRVDSIVRWGTRWIVATSSGLISTP